MATHSDHRLRTMVRLLTLALTVASAVQTAAAQAQTYFAADAPRKWTMRMSVLDKNQVPVDSLTYPVSFAFTPQPGLTYSGRSCLRYSQSVYPGVVDSAYWSFDGNDAWNFINPLGFTFMQPIIDTLKVSESLKKYGGWYDILRFQQSPGQDYELIRFDTTVTVSGYANPIPLRFQVAVVRLADQTITVPYGTFSACKTFVIRYQAGTVVTIPFVGTQFIPFVTLPDTLVVAPQKWIVHSNRPSMTVDLSAFNLGVYEIPGMVSNLMAATAVERTPAAELPREYITVSSYPNPFNPAVRIRITALETGPAELTVYDAAGRLCARLFTGVLRAGSAEVVWNAGGHPSGVYYARLRQGTHSAVRALVLTK